jgi:CRP-like cAMP-binding protein
MFMKSLLAKKSNFIIAALPNAVRERWCAQGQLVDLKAGEMFSTNYDSLQHLYLPTTAVLSWNKLLENGDTTQLVMVGHEGLFGLLRVLGHDVNATQGVVQCSGRAWRIPIEVVRSDYKQPGPTHDLILEQLQRSFTQLSQLAICNRFHTLEQQLCRLLLMTRDRLGTIELPMTHEQMAGLLGARREGVSNAAGKLMHARLIKYVRGRITLLDPEGLARRTCECYKVICGD